MLIKSSRAILFAALTATSLAASAPSFAQSNRELDDRVRRLERAVQSLAQEPAPGMAGPGAMGGDSGADLVNRILKLEQLVEQLTGQIEETRFRTQQSAKTLDQLANDLSLRVAMLEQGGAIPPGAAPTAALPPGAGAALGAPAAAAQTAMSAAPAPRVPPPGSRPYGEDGALSRPLTPQPTPRPQQQPQAAQPATNTNLSGAALDDPALSQPTSPGGFGALRTDAQGRPLAADPALASLPPPVAEPATPTVAPAPQRAPNPAAVAATGLGVQGATPIDVSLPEGTPKQQYDYAFEFLKKQDYGRAEVAFREFMKRYPKDALAGNAQYWLGETHYVRGDYQKSVIEFMSGYQNYPKSNKGPDNLLKLGMSLSHLGQSKEACTALSRIAKEYPDAGEQIKRATQQERQKLKCA